MEYNDKISTVVQNVPPSAIRRFFDLASEMKDVISLSIGEPDFVTPWSIREAGINSLVDGYTHYSPNAGYIESRRAICSYINKRYGIEYNPTKPRMAKIAIIIPKKMYTTSSLLYNTITLKK
mgnify:CR=1 FL=1